MIYDLAAKPLVIDYLISGGSVDDLIRRIDSWLDERGYVRGEMLTGVRSDGVIFVDTDRDPSAEWDDFDPSVEVGQHATSRQERIMVQGALTALQAGTLSSVNQQKVLAWVVTRELARSGL